MPETLKSTSFANKKYQVMQYLLVFLTFSLSHQYVSAEPFHTPSIILNSTVVCPSKSAINEVKRIVEGIINKNRDLSRPSNLSRPCKCGGPEWTMVGYLNMSNPTHHCPANWSISNDSVRGCGRRSSGYGGTCDSVLFPVNDLLYSSVCGRIVAYQKGGSVAFQYSNLYNSISTIEDPYVSGISLTHGAVGSRQHIWTFAGANGKQITPNHEYWYCSCTNASLPWPYQVPSYVGNDYFCDSGNPVIAQAYRVYLGDPLWDGAGCHSSSNSCCQLNNPPWFCKHLQYSFTDDLELRLCAYNPETLTDKLITLVEIYVK